MSSVSPHLHALLSLTDPSDLIDKKECSKGFQQQPWISIGSMSGSPISLARRDHQVDTLLVKAGSGHCEICPPNLGPWQQILEHKKSVTKVALAAWYEACNYFGFSRGGSDSDLHNAIVYQALLACQPSLSYVYLL